MLNASLDTSIHRFWTSLIIQILLHKWKNYSNSTSRTN